MYVLKLLRLFYTEVRFWGVKAGANVLATIIGATGSRRDGEMVDAVTVPWGWGLI